MDGFDRRNQRSDQTSSSKKRWLQVQSRLLGRVQRGCNRRLGSAVTRLSAPFQGRFAEGTERVKGFMWRRMREGGYTQAIISDNHLEMQKLDLVLLENSACPSLLT